MLKIELHITKALLVVVLLMGLSFTVHSQMVSQYTMWNQNHYLINPAAAGNLNYSDVNLGYRQQWTGVKHAPRTFYATYHSVLNKPRTYQRSALRISSSSSIRGYNKRTRRPTIKHALGGTLNNNEFGAFKNSSIYLSYAFHLPVYKDLMLSFGASGGLSSYGFDESRALAAESNDPIFDAYVTGENSNKINANSGIYLYSERFFVGYSGFQLLQNKLEIADIKTNSKETNLKVHHFLVGGYNFDLTNDFRLTPAVMLKKLNPNPLSFDFTTTLTYRQEIYMGLGYRGEDAVSVMLGMQLNHFMKVGYSYDYTLSELSERSTGSHELFIGMTLF
mgnify:CR=1 FL=1